MVAIPKDINRLKVEALIEGNMFHEPHRPYCGISGIGKTCPRDIWYGFRWATERFDTARQHRLFQRGHREEPIVIADLKAIGCKVTDRQTTVTTGQGHIKGHTDGVVHNLPDAPKTPHLLEIKTANDANFKKIKKSGMKASKPGYWAQAQCYMKEMKLTRCLFVVVNKNNDARYYERAHYEPQVAQDYMIKTGDIIFTEVPPARIGGPNWWECKFCDHYEVCQFNAPPARNCRTCGSLDMYRGGRWRCSLHKAPRGYKNQLLACAEYELMSGLI